MQYAPSGKHLITYERSKSRKNITFVYSSSKWLVLSAKTLQSKLFYTNSLFIILDRYNNKLQEQFVFFFSEVVAKLTIKHKTARFVQKSTKRAIYMYLLSEIRRGNQTSRDWRPTDTWPLNIGRNANSNPIISVSADIWLQISLSKVISVGLW